MIQPWTSPIMPFRVYIAYNDRGQDRFERERTIRRWCVENVGQEGVTAEVYLYKPHWEYKDSGGMWYSTGQTWFFRNSHDAFNFVLYWK